ncbi:helix-turn-helix domain-containing protein [Caenimonas koreensis]|uniref:helix-turn-helix domain-containing protein n=1 Tax=Caenimonas koreensis TaxID=367474 RepID=UPI0037838A9A
MKLIKTRVESAVAPSSSRARISRYELGVHEPPIATARQIAEALRVPLPFLYCDDDDVAALLLAMFEMSKSARRERAKDYLKALARGM